jgi:hypothetical protein
MVRCFSYAPRARRARMVWWRPGVRSAGVGLEMATIRGGHGDMLAGPGARRCAQIVAPRSLPSPAAADGSWAFTRDVLRAAAPSMARCRMRRDGGALAWRAAKVRQAAQARCLCPVSFVANHLAP